MLDVELSIRDFDGRAVVALRGELNLADTRVAVPQRPAAAMVRHSGGGPATR